MLKLRNKFSSVPEEMDVLILAGGLGTRLRPCISDKPKGLAPVNGRPFLDLLVDNLLPFGFQRFIFCVGHLKDQIVAHYVRRDDCQIVFSVETGPLGTGGAIRNAFDKISSEIVLVLNGDSFCRVNYLEFMAFHLAKRASLSIAVTETNETQDFGTIALNSNGQIESFEEKVGSVSGFVNAGIYIFEKEILNSLMSMGKIFSLERDFFPEIINAYPTYGFKVATKLWDIGTPERYQAFCDNYRPGL